MNDERDLRRYAARRAALNSALRSGDALVAARAGSRLRLDGFLLTSDEFARARDARRALGLAVVKARMAKPADVPLRREPEVAESPRSHRRLIAAAAIAAAVLIALLFFGNGRGLGPAGGGTPAANDAQQQRQQAQLVAVSRGRTIVLPADVVAVEASPTPAPTADATATAPVAPTTSGGNPAPTSGPGGTGNGGSGGGSGGGNGSGTGSGSGTGTSTPVPTATPPVPPPGFSRLNVIVYDATTGRPLPDVCIIIGTLNCGPSAPHTDQSGRWSADVAASSNSTLWDLYFIKQGFNTQFRQITLPGGQTRTYAIYLRRLR